MQTRISLRCSRKKCSVSFSAPICVLNYLLLVSSADNLFKQLGPRSDPAKLSCENGAHVKSRMSLRCWRGKCFFFYVHISVLQLPQLFNSTEFSCRNTLRLSAVSYQHSLLERKVLLFFSDHLILSVFLLVPFFPQSSIQFCRNSCFSSVCSCENAHMSLRFLNIFLGRVALHPI